jgi:kanamycin kinase
VPLSVVAAAAGDPLDLAWVNEAGGLAYAAGDGERRRFIKWAPAGSGLDLAGEAARLSWARRFHPVPDPLAWGQDEAGSWLVTAALPGENAASQRWRSDPATAVAAIGQGLRALHDNLPLTLCPFTWSAAQRVAEARASAAAGTLDPTAWHLGHHGLTTAEALARAADIPPPDQLVVCHGDSCAPNTLLSPDGRWSAHVDLGLLGVADRWADLAVAAWSTTWNYGPGWERPLLDAYGVEPDPERIQYYRLLWDLSS